MEILGIGPGEFVLILIVLLVVVGPERLPGLARQAANILVRARNWLQTSPDAALVLRARQEIEAELASLRSGLLEVQNVRDEVLGAAKQLEDSVGSIASTKLDLKSMINAPVGQTIARDQPVATAVPNDQLILPDGSAADPSAPHAPTTIELPDGTTTVLAQPADTQHSNGIAKPSLRQGQPALAQAELESINIKLQAIMADMWTLQTQLKERGVLDEAWQPPSLSVQLPEPTPEPVADDTDADSNPIKDSYASQTLDIDATPPLTEAEAESRLLASAAEYVALYEDPVIDAAAPSTPEVTDANSEASLLASPADAAKPNEMPTDADTEASLFVDAADESEPSAPEMPADTDIEASLLASAADESEPSVPEAPADVDSEASLLVGATDPVKSSAPEVIGVIEAPTNSELATTTEQPTSAEADAAPAAKARKHRVSANVEQTEDRETVATEEAS